MTGDETAACVLRLIFIEVSLVLKAKGLMLDSMFIIRLYILISGLQGLIRWHLVNQFNLYCCYV